MMIHDDIDDETTLEDAEEEDSDELDNLQEVTYMHRTTHLSARLLLVNSPCMYGT